VDAALADAARANAAIAILVLVLGLGSLEGVMCVLPYCLATWLASDVCFGLARELSLWFLSLV
jgi:hypothetical protein